MKKQYWIFLLIIILVSLVACSEEEDEEAEDDLLVPLEVEFELPEAVDVDETVELEAVVTYGDDLVVDADAVKFEYWLGDDEDDSTMVESENNEDGTYTAEVTFTEDGVYTLYAHTDAEGLHTMPKRQIAVGDAEITEDEDNNTDEENSHIDGFSMEFNEPESPEANQDIDLTTEITLEEEPLENADVRYEIWMKDDDDGEHEWIDSEEVNPGEYTSTHTFSQADTYTIQIHVEDDEDLHEHEEFDVEVTE